MLQLVAVLEAVRGRQDVPPVDQRASAFVLDAPEYICRISKFWETLETSMCRNQVRKEID